MTKSITGSPKSIAGSPKSVTGSPKYGKLPARHDERTLSYEKYITPAKLPPVPETLHWEQKLPADWGMMGNYNFSDCTVASAGHLVMSWTGNAAGKPKVIPEKEIIAAYSAITGFNPVTHTNDNGAGLLEVLNYWRKTGIGNDKIEAFVALEHGNHAQLKEAVFLFGGCYIGLQLPDTATVAQKVWTVPTMGTEGAGKPNPDNGHAVPVLGYDDRFLYIITWGKVKLMTWKFFETYCDEAYALLSPDWFNKKGKAPQGFNLPLLEKDLQRVSKPKRYFTTGEFSGVEATDTFALAAKQQSAVISPIGAFAWPDSLGPKPATIPGLPAGGAVNKPLTGGYDVLLLAYTDQEFQALLEVFTGKSVWSATTKKTAYAYTHNFSQFKSKITMGLTDALKAGIFGYLLPFTIGAKKVMVYKSELHPKNNGLDLPFVGVTQQLIDDIKPACLITTGTAGAIGTHLNIGDVVITDVARLHCTGKPYIGYTDITTLSNKGTELKSAAKVNFITRYIDYANANLTGLSIPGMNQCYGKLKNDAGYSFLRETTNNPTIYAGLTTPVPGPQPMDIVSANSFTVADNSNLDDLQSQGILNDTDDAFVAYAISKMPAASQPKWVSVRNASEPQIPDPGFPSGSTQAQQISILKGIAGGIFGVYQYCTTINSAFACWGIVAGL